jgi:DNA repair exonuclease SbcCD nuclease subunit
MRFIHTADIHLDSPLVGLAAYPDAPAHLLRTATRDAFDNLITEAITEKVDFMVIAGDLFDGNWKDFNTGIYFARQMGRLQAAGIPVYLLLGNHDAESEMTRKLVLPANVHRFPSNKAATFEIPALRVALHGRSFKDAATTDNLAVHYPEPVAGWFNIGVLHTALEGNNAHASYAPCSIAELEARGYQYWALGHVHEHRVWRGATTVAFCGNLQGRHIREAGPRGALLVTATGSEIDSVERLIVDVLRWHALPVDVSACQDLADVVRCVGRAMEALLAQAQDERPIALHMANCSGWKRSCGPKYWRKPLHLALTGCGSRRCGWTPRRMAVPMYWQRGLTRWPICKPCWPRPMLTPPSCRACRTG